MRARRELCLIMKSELANFCVGQFDLVGMIKGSAYGHFDLTNIKYHFERFMDRSKACFLSYAVIVYTLPISPVWWLVWWVLNVFTWKDKFKSVFKYVYEHFATDKCEPLQSYWIIYFWN